MPGVPLFEFDVESCRFPCWSREQDCRRLMIRVAFGRYGPVSPRFGTVSSATGAPAEPAAGTFHQPVARMDYLKLHCCHALPA
jgi:hypothetical protein